MSTDLSQPTAAQDPERPRWSLSGLLGSLRFALGVVLLITAACVAGTLLPQGQQQVAQYLQHNPDARGRMELLTTLGLTDVFFSKWFVGLLCVLSASLSVCTYRRYVALRRATGARRLRVLGSLITHISLLLILAGGVIRAGWGAKGFIEFREGDTVNHFVGHGGPVHLPFDLKLVDFTLETYQKPEAPVAKEDGDRLVVTWPAYDLTNVLPAAVGSASDVTIPGVATAGSYRVSVRRYVPDFILDNATREVRSRSERPNNPAVLAVVSDGSKTNEQWLFARYPDFGMHGPGGAVAEFPLRLRYESPAAARAVTRTKGPIKDYKSTLNVLVDGKVVQEKTIEVNTPLSYGGFTFYQSGYDPDDLTSSTLQVVRDPGVLVVYAGFVLMMVGLTIVFWIAPSLESSGRKAGGA